LKILKLVELIAANANLACTLYSAASFSGWNYKQRRLTLQKSQGRTATDTILDSGDTELYILEKLVDEETKKTWWTINYRNPKLLPKPLITDHKSTQQAS
jgi:hypothetical protein